MAKGSNKIIATIICKNNNEKKHLNQDLNIKVVVWFIKHKITKGAKRIRTFIKIYLREKLITRVKEEIERVLDNIPSIENILKLLFKVLFNSFVKVTNDISFPNISLPNKQKNEDNSCVISIKKVQIDKELFIKIAINNALMKNFQGGSIWFPWKVWEK